MAFVSFRPHIAIVVGIALTPGLAQAHGAESLIVIPGLLIGVPVVLVFSTRLVKRWWATVLSCLGAIATAIVSSQALLVMASSVVIDNVNHTLLLIVILLLGLLLPIAGGLGVAYGIRAVTGRRKRER